MSPNKRSVNHIPSFFEFHPKITKQSWKTILCWHPWDYELCFSDFFPLKVILSYIFNVLSLSTNVYQAMVNLISHVIEYYTDVTYWGCFLCKKIYTYGCGDVLIAQATSWMEGPTCCTVHTFLDCLEWTKCTKCVKPIWIIIHMKWKLRKSWHMETCKIALKVDRKKKGTDLRATSFK